MEDSCVGASPKHSLADLAVTRRAPVLLPFPPPLPHVTSKIQATNLYAPSGTSCIC
jgi:hypothetical protein